MLTVGRNSEAYCAVRTQPADYASLIRPTHPDSWNASKP